MTFRVHGIACAVLLKICVHSPHAVLIGQTTVTGVLRPMGLTAGVILSPVVEDSTQRGMIPATARNTKISIAFTCSLLTWELRELPSEVSDFLS